MGEVTVKLREGVGRAVRCGASMATLVALAGCGSSSGDSARDAGNTDGGGSVDASAGVDGFAQARDAGLIDSTAAGGDSGSSDTGDSGGPGDGLAWLANPDAGCPSPGSVGDGSAPTVDGGLVSATIVDLDGAPLGGFFTQVCGLNSCSAPQATNDAGAVTIDATRLSLEKPVLGYGDALDFPLLLVPVPVGPTVDLGVLVSAALPSAGASFVSGGDALSADVTVSIPPGGAAIVDTILYDTGDKQALRAVAIPPAKASAMPGVAANSLALLYGVAPIDTLFCPAARVTVANRAGWPAGARVGFYILGDDTAEPWAPYGDWGLISHGSVSADGASIRTADGEGFPVLETFGVRLEP